MGKLIFSFTNFIGIKVERVKLPSYIEPPFNLRAKYSELLPEISTMVRPYFYIATSEKSEAAYIREMEAIPDLFPLVAYPGNNSYSQAHIIKMIGLYINELTDSGIDKVESACQIIQQTLMDVGLEFDPSDIEILMMIPQFSIDLSDTQENIMEENNQKPKPEAQKPQQQNRRPKNKGKGKPQGKGKGRKPYTSRPVTVGDMLGPEFVAELMAKVKERK